MPTPGLIIGLAGAVLGTAILSGILGMAGGMILMGVFAWTLPVGAAMMLHGLTQAVSNGYRAILNRNDIQWGLLTGYAVGAAGALALFAAISFVPDKKTVFLVLGAIPFAALAIPKQFTLDITKSGASPACGFIVTSFHLTAGVSGPMLDVFYVKSPLTRHQVVASKAVTQTLSHLLKLVYFGLIVGALAADAANGEALSLPWYVFAMVIPLAMIGTTLGKKVLDKMSDHHFRRWSQAILLVIGAVFIIRGLALLAG